MAILETDRRDWKLDDAGDLILPLEYVSGLEAVAQGIRIRTRMFRGEWFLNRMFGVPYLDNDLVSEDEALLGQRYNETRARAAIRAAILDTDDDVTILALELLYDSALRTLEIAARVRTAFGDTTVQISTGV